MNFKEKIKLHNEDKYDLASELLDLAQSDMVNTKLSCKRVRDEFYNDVDGHSTNTFNQWRADYPVKKDIAEYHMAKNIRIWIAQYTKRAYRIRKREMFEGSQLDIAEYDVLNFIYTTLLAVDYEIHKDEFDKIPKSVFKAIEDKFGWGVAKRFKDEIKPFQDILPAINRTSKKLTDQYAPLILESLNEVLPLVDLNRTEKEIIGFIAISTKHKVDRKLTKLLETKVHNIKGQKYYVTKETIRSKKFIRTEAESLLPVNHGRLTSNQSSFYTSLMKKIQKEIDAINIEPFTFDIEGNIIGFNKRFFAAKLEMKESAFKNRLKRIEEKGVLPVSVRQVI